MVFSKNKLRTHYKWINHNWVLPITNHKEDIAHLIKQVVENS
ncbi:hypothetical protein glysoja_026802 [Glycine soja]|uniref:Uncharacterized protein n=1 Tax=Glycine soja TaxID=3848 RepID=A0A0B2Q0R4_GLYSO|nr:hypothetical protein glysoja_026802 [Glycine soja]